ncbi:UDP-N-acetylmuramoyl-L-alanyl-D-glutamate--2,6-diaminopimelate ligase [Parashewanella spongiae]|uniref:UDP-N-acetylmuramoyl-L-alanyl-D-glutamate--2,6-diaminopimelate ligase n=2 Tax=Parashewanella spongiae TaxID=342950 RepID=A0A3A6TLU8_9GAMM|nr:UDP-N-acetylmuramoyl-L-alanyl-D-glutamate--2,6-diaminopimelate ligase [Parashewanella spongiae]MCL1078906.1 UDP-N-acetylmuramoyl-L-alanyl-D-glutamate--2,6-diaminopimelate ligase [Parashewanella spongiae]RJY11434.1 UDP-N-acetylmuramoyl-L-alanyl-D-glutamate--2,6-diaminopimelate ligase [Parashewanella spongiae]
MKIADFLAPWFDDLSDNELCKTHFEHLVLDSRKVQQEDIFVAIPGHQVDGRRFINQAIERGAVLCLAHTNEMKQHGLIEQAEKSKILYFYQLAEQLSTIACHRYPVDNNALKIIAVTGTNGKTTVSQLIAQLARLTGINSAVMGTLGNGLWGQLQDTGNTTADAITVAKQLHELQQQGVRLCVMEVSSHALIQHRVAAISFSSAIMTNLSRDHLDYHGDMASYAAAKKQLFQFPSLSHQVFNLDDDTAQQWFVEMSSDIGVGFSVEQQNGATFATRNEQFHPQGMTADFSWPDGHGKIESSLLGHFNLSNLVAAITVMALEGFDVHQLLENVPKLEAVPGRMECYHTKNRASVVVDYAHTPDALAKALDAIRLHCDNQLWCLFGCGGDRDKGKRALMAKTAEQKSDNVVITSDNPRTESPQQIIADILTGINRLNTVSVEADRVTAIKQSFAQIQAGDVLLLAGKGHETYQEINGVKHHYDERALVTELVRAQP